MAGITDGISNLFSSVFEIFSGIINTVLSGLQSIFGLFQSLVSSIFGLFQSVISSIFDLMSGLVGFMLSKLPAFLLDPLTFDIPDAPIIGGYLLNYMIRQYCHYRCPCRCLCRILCLSPEEPGWGDYGWQEEVLGSGWEDNA